MIEYILLFIIAPPLIYVAYLIGIKGLKFWRPMEEVFGENHNKYVSKSGFIKIDDASSEQTAVKE